MTIKKRENIFVLLFYYPNKKKERDETIELWNSTVTVNMAALETADTLSFINAKNTEILFAK